MRSAMRVHFDSIKGCRCLTHNVTVKTYRDWLDHLKTYHALAAQEARDGE